MMSNIHSLLLVLLVTILGTMSSSLDFSGSIDFSWDFSEELSGSMDYSWDFSNEFSDEYSVAFSTDFSIEFSSIPSYVPTVIPTIAPTTIPTSPIVCVNGDRTYCNNRGYCNVEGTSCVCDDYYHYWPSERCSILHQGRELEEGQYCYPNTVDYYCSWMGVCNADGSACNCFDSEHRTSADRCLTWSPTPPPTIDDGTCPVGDRAPCNNQGRCGEDGSCICDDPLHYWSNENCAIQHYGPQLEDGQCCSPGSTDYYCAWMGQCNMEGSACACYDSNHRLPSERCQFWHEDVNDPTLPTLPPNTCPPEIVQYSASPSLAPTYYTSSHPTVSNAPVFSPTFFPTPTTGTASPTPTSGTTSPTFTPSKIPSVTPTIAPTNAPTSSPTHAPTKSPSISPTLSPTQNICLPNDRSYCSNRGTCSATGSGCECDDVLHYWPSEKCSTWHQGGELESGQYCTPNTVDSYCSWMGVCNADGSACNCFDSEHRTSADRCFNWSPTESVPPVGDGTCPPNSRGYCFNRGTCNSAGNGCACDDPMHYWSSERCEITHYGPELQDGQCCSPNQTDYYCGWLGTCNSVGLSCLCHESNHRLPSERCFTYHNILPPATNVTTDPTECPALLVLESDSSKKTKSSNNQPSKYRFGWPYWTAVISFLVLGGLAYVVYQATVGGAAGGNAAAAKPVGRLVEMQHITMKDHAFDEENGVLGGGAIVRPSDDPAFQMINPLEEFTQI